MAKKLPAGQRAVGWFKLRSTPEGSLHREFELCIPIGEDPRAVAMECHFSWDRPDDQPASYGISFRGARISVRVPDLYDEVVQSVTRYVEGLDTSTKRQRFRVMRAHRVGGTRSSASRVRVAKAKMGILVKPELRRPRKR